MQKSILSALAAGIVCAGMVLGAPAPASAAQATPLAERLSDSGAPTEYVRFGKGRGGFGRGGGFGGRGLGRRGFAGRGGFRRGGFAGRGGFYGRPRAGYGYGYRRRGPGAGAVLGGLAAGALIGGAIAAQAAPGPAGGAAASCAQRFKSYDAASGTYLGYDGQRHPCP